MSDEAHDSPSYPPPPDDLVLLAPAAAPRDDGPDHHEPALRHGEKRPRGEYAPAEVDGDAAKRRRDGRRGYTRTGQACDRCKARKVKCDALPGGCSPCAAAAVDCVVTDRVSGRTERRGYLQDLERERERMVGYIRDLEGVVAARTDLRLRPSPWTADFGGQAVEPGEWEQVGAVVFASRQDGGR